MTERPDEAGAANSRNAENESAGAKPTPSAPTSTQDPTKHASRKRVHEVAFVTYPKLLFVWPLILVGFLFWPFSSSDFSAPAAVADVQQQAVDPGGDAANAADAAATPHVSPRLERLGWIYILIAFVVFLTLGVDVDRNQFVFWIVVILALWIGGRWLADVKGFTLFGDIYRWFAWLDVQYNRSFGLSLSLVLLVPYLLMIAWAHVNDKWRITHNEFEHYSLGKMDDSLGRGAKTIRTGYPDLLELLLGLAGTLVVYNATGTKELRRIPHIMFLPFVRKRLNQILERTAITTAEMEGDEDDDDA